MSNRYSATYTAFRLIIFLAIFLVSRASSVAYGQEHDAHAAVNDSAHADATHAGAGAHKDNGKFNPTETIMEHIKDAHDWHLWGHTAIHLPVILYTDKGVELFSSGRFNHGHDAYTGNHYTYKNIHEKIKVVDEAGNVDEAATAHITDLSITKNVATMLLVVIVLIIVFTSVAKAYGQRKGQAPKGLQSALEPIILFVRDEIAKPNLGHKTEKFMPYLLTVFFFIWFCNMLGLVPFFPGGANLTGNIALTMVLAVITLVLTNVNGNKHYWQHIFWMPGIPLPVKLLLTPIEVIGIFTKAIALMIRLFANITAGHILVLSLTSLIFIFKSYAVAGIAVPFVAAISLIELIVGFIQAFIFTVLSALYIGIAIEDHHEEAHH